MTAERLKWLEAIKSGARTCRSVIARVRLGARSASDTPGGAGFFRGKKNIAGLVALLILVSLNVVLAVGPRVAFSDPKFSDPRLGGPELQSGDEPKAGDGAAAPQTAPEGYTRALPPIPPSKGGHRPRSVRADAPVRATAANDYGAETVDPTTGGASDKTRPIPVAIAEDSGGGTITATNQPAGTETTLGNKPAVPGESSPPIPDEVRKAQEGDAAGGDASEIGANAGGEGNTFSFLDVQDAEIATLVKTFSKLTGRNYIVDTAVKGKITIHLPTAVTMQEALRIFDSVLLLKGFTTVPMGANTWKVITAKDAKQTTIPTVEGGKDRSSEALVTELIRLRHTQSADLQQVLTQFVSKDGMLSAFAPTNSLIVIDSGSNIRRVKELVDQLDVPALDQDITIIPITHAEAKDLAEKIDDILGNKDKEGATGDPRLGAFRGRGAAALPLPLPVAGMPGQPPVNQTTTAGGTIAGEKRTLPFRIIPDERTNSLIVVADPLTTDKVRALVEQLDSSVDKSTGRFFVYRLQHADSEELAEILGNLISGSGGSSGSSTSSDSSSRNRSRSSNSSRRGGSTAGITNAGLGGSQFGRSRNALGGATDGTPGGSFGGSGGSVLESGKVNLEGEVSIAADPSTNSLVINASKKDYEKLKQVIDELDVKRRQVLVEATILEVSLTKDEGLGVELQGTAGTDDGGIFGQTNFNGLTNLITNPAALSDLTIAAASTGSIVLPGGITLPSQALLITALSRNTNVNVLSSPSILATDNEEAKIVVGENVPFVTSTSTSDTNLNNTFNQIERQDVGITLTITPQISTGDFVILKIFVEISNVVPGTRNDPNGPTTTIRTTETVVEVKSGQMIATGGLIQDAVTDSSRGAPFLEDIPVLGNLFRRDDSNQRRTNLLVFITPKIVNDQFVAREETIEKSAQFEKEVEYLGSEPDRKEVLHSEKIDRVTENIPPFDTPPGTIRPARGALSASGNGIDRARGAAGASESDAARSRTFARLERLSHSTGSQNAGSESDAAASDDEESLEITVAPSLPGAGSAEGGAPAATRARSTGKSGSPGSLPAAAARTRPPPSVEELLDEELGDRPAPGKPSRSSSERESPGARRRGSGADTGDLSSAPGRLPPSARGALSTSPLADTSLDNAAGSGEDIPVRAVGSGATYVVLRQLSGSAGKGGQAPFRFADSAKTVGMLVPLAAADGQGAFQTGGRYQFRNSQGTTFRFVCLGSYPSIEEAGRAHPALSNKRAWQSVPASALGGDDERIGWSNG